MFALEYEKWRQRSYFARKYGQTWVLYHDDAPRKALWEDYNIKGLREWIAANGCQNDEE